ncbi:MAG: hypothetical protein ACSHW7_03295 [Patiriisocius sp.]|uniref:hypothetical protein n=1 Tax=Patiriisocius sp. TaxID=2822396 RepID=UPI003EF2E0CA
MAHQQNDEIDLGFLLDKINGVFRNLAIGIYNTIQYIFKYWYLILGLLILGIALGYFVEKDIRPSKKANIVLRTNFNSTEYAYNALEALLMKSKSKDTAFLKEYGFYIDEIGDIVIKPIISFEEITSRYDPDDRILESVLRNVEFKDDEMVSESFLSNYKNHEVEIMLAPSSSEKTVDKIITYLNANSKIKQLSAKGKEELINNIARHEFSLKQIDSTISNYNDKIILASSNERMVVVDKNFNYNSVLIVKQDIQKVLTKLKEDLVYADNAIVLVSNNIVSQEKRPLYVKKFIIYPILFIFLFLLASWILKKYARIGELAKSKN